MTTAHPMRKSGSVTVRDQPDAERIAVLEVYNAHQDWMVELNNAYARPAPNQDLPPELAGLVWVQEAVPETKPKRSPRRTAAEAHIVVFTLST